MSTTRILKGAHNFKGAVEMDSSLTLDNGTYNEAHLILGAQHLWIGDDYALRKKSSAPASQSDGDELGPVVNTFTTIDETPTAISWTVPSDSMTYFQVAAFGLDASYENCVYVFDGYAHKTGSTVTVGATSRYSYESDAAFNCTVAESSGDLKVTCTGLATASIKWKVVLSKYTVSL